MINIVGSKICVKNSLIQVGQVDILGLSRRQVLNPNLDPRMPFSRADAQKVIIDLGLDYETIDACLCDEVLYFGDNVDALVCSKCNVLRCMENLKNK
jgi:hypothetical protein